MTEESLKISARDLAASERTGTLSTVSARHPGYPFGSLVQYALDPQGHPVFLISGLAVHTRNIQANPRASLLIARSEQSAEPGAAARLTLVGDIERLDGDGAAAVRDLFLSRHPDAAQWVEFGDFAFYRLMVKDAYYVGGFGVMGWISGSAWSA